MGPLECQMPPLLGDPGMTVGDDTGKPNQTSDCAGAFSGEDVYRFVAATTGQLDITLTPTGNANLVLYVRSVCDDPGSSLGCFNNTGNGGVESASLMVNQGDTVFIFVDGVSGSEGPYTLSASTSPIVCGDKLVGPGEQCDPPNGGSCDPACQYDVPFICAGSTLLAASNPGDNTASTSAFTGSCSGAGNEVLYSYTFASAGVLALALDSADDMALYARSSCSDPNSETGCVDFAPAGGTEHLNLVGNLGDSFTIFADGFTPADLGPFTLTSTFTGTNEIEPNDTAAMANNVASPITAFISPAGDDDWFTVPVAGPAAITLDVQDTGNNACANGQLDSYVELVSTDGTTVLSSNDDINAAAGNYCSQLTMLVITPGTYYAHVSSSQMFSPNATFPYRLVITVQ